ncbi:hypothetical protein BDR07DRAFT_1392944 [Suillus spraguei]|nr:hypothetical protein BDR07DRAFT_1392944 [Suillus spraguei]
MLMVSLRRCLTFELGSNTDPLLDVGQRHKEDMQAEKLLRPALHNVNQMRDMNSVVASISPAEVPNNHYYDIYSS